MNKIQKSSIGLSIAALGVVFGDIGTSPLYVMSAAFGKIGYHLAINSTNILGVISLITWSLVIIVTIQFIIFLMKADNGGEGGILSLVALIKNKLTDHKYQKYFIFLGIFGLALFFGDSTITPAISVLSAVEGLKIINPNFSSFIIPITITIIITLFAIQKKGTNFIGHLFGPIMFSWFSVIAIGGFWRITQYPKILIAILPTTAINFLASHPTVAFISMGAVVLAVTGSEALYADLGHFGRKPISKAWYFVVFPALVLCYLGEGALLLSNSANSINPFFLLFPKILTLPIIVLATIATIIASQSVISGAYSLTKQAIQLNFLPKMLIHHTSKKEVGQIYLSFINFILFLMVIFLVIFFKSSTNLANAYGMAVSGTLLIDAILYLVLISKALHRSKYKLLLISLILLPLDLLFVVSNLSKFFLGGYIPIIISLIIFELILTWIKGQVIIVRERRALEGPLQDFIEKIHTQKPSIKRIPGVGVFIGHHTDLAPLALHAILNELNELHQKVIIVSVEIINQSHVTSQDRAVINNLGYENDGISHVNLKYGFHDHINIPEALEKIEYSSEEINTNLSAASYFISLSEIVPSKRHNMSWWRKAIYVFMAKNATSTSEFYQLPLNRTMEIRYLISL